MPDGGDSARIEVVRSLTTIERDEWNACAGPENPFLSWEFLSALEETGCVRPETGWLPQHLVMCDVAGRLEAAAVLYLKGNSQGEYVFDYAWAHAYERAGGSYYPKLLSAIPFTPVTGPRLLTRAANDKARAEALLISGMAELTDRHDVSSLHVNFAEPDQADVLEKSGFLIRHGHQFHWYNRGYETFDDFLDGLASRKRKSIRKERRRVAEAGIRLRHLTGDDLKERHWDSFYRFYSDTYDRKWGAPYLNRAFFSALRERMRDRVLLVMAEMDDTPIAGALNLIGRDTLYGRNWGCDIAYKFLHFEACYYQAIDFAIERGLARVEAGTQGEHKIQRGYEPVKTYSAHWIPDPAFREAVGRFLEEERAYEADARAYLSNHAPFKKDGPSH